MNIAELTAKERNRVLRLFLGERVSILFREFVGKNDTHSGILSKEGGKLFLLMNDGYKMDLHLFREPSVLYSEDRRRLETARKIIQLMRVFS